MELYISNYYKNGTLTEQVRLLSLFRDLVMFGKTTLDIVSDKNRDYDFIKDLDEKNQFIFLIYKKKYFDMGKSVIELAEEVYKTTDIYSDEYELKEYLEKNSSYLHTFSSNCNRIHRYPT